MTDPRETLARIRKQADAATEGPWEHEPPPGPGEDPMRPICVYPKEDGGTLAYVQPLEADAAFIAHARTDVPDMAAALRAVLEIHQDGGESQGYTDTGTYDFMPHCCTECGSLGEYGVPYPCPTVTAIRQHLGEDT